MPTENKFKKLAIISDCVHMFNPQGEAVTEVHIFCRQMQALASFFDQTVICCPFVPYKGNTTTTAYTNKTIGFAPVKNAGGDSLKSKLGLIANIPSWLSGFRKAVNGADIVYMRFPNNLNIIGFFYFYLKGSKIFATYTGTWANYNGEPLTYRFQKWIIKKLLSGPAWVYITDEKAGKNLYKGISPSYTLGEWEEETEQVKLRVEKIKTIGIPKPVFMTVGVLNANKNQQYILNACKILRDEGFAFYLYVVGDGELKTAYEEYITQNNLQDCINICGKKTYDQLRALYRNSDFLIQATLVEGFGKVPIEGFFHGVVPLLNRVALADEMTGNGERGFVFSATDTANLVKLIKKVCANTGDLPKMIENARQYAKVQTLENWAQSYIKKINEYFV
jgi:glycosyltransferase involved in cell wall biosynthesis